jgi:hypothetical protein
LEVISSEESAYESDSDVEFVGEKKKEDEPVPEEKIEVLTVAIDSDDDLPEVDEQPEETPKPEPLFKNVEIPPVKVDTQMVIDDTPAPKKPVGKNVQKIEDILMMPGRMTRPSKICIIMRGIPGSGKTHLAKLIKDKEVEMGGSTPRILNIDGEIILLV